MKRIAHNKPCLNDEEVVAVTKVLRNEWIIAGDEVSLFEENFKKYIGAKYAVAVNSGTSALHLALLALEVQRDDEVILPTYTSSDLLNAIHYVGAKPILVDSVRNSCTVNIEEIPNKITKKTKVMIIPHTFGFPTDIEQLATYEIPIIEDSAQTIGSTLHGRIVGTFGMVSIFSFFATKLLTTGQGGMVVTNNRAIFEFVKDLIDYNGRDNYKVRYNYPMTDIAASIGNVQLGKYDSFSAKRRKIAGKYQAMLETKNILHYPTKKETHVIPFRFLIQCSDEKMVMDIKKVCKEADIEVRQPIFPYELLHRLLGQDKSNFPYAEQFAKTVLSLPIYPYLSDEDIERITMALSRAL